ncbi:hypothetical protein [Sandarakinorhabdus sp.]|uniref:hypothetical protein n=1 Tax=Sandarakinorhabdus sp. TaxID=1916663 RepID=UPI00286E644B|nr:hypothetical protein [Sandarakinorhabdus sp.]
MMNYGMVWRSVVQIVAGLLLLGSAGSAALGATATSCATIAQDLVASAAGGVVTTGPITCPARIVINKAVLPGVTLDATGAAFPEGVTIANSSGLHIEGGTYGTLEKDTRERQAIQISGSSHVIISGAKLLGLPLTLGATGAWLTGDRGGIYARNSTWITVRDSECRRFRVCVTFYETTDSLAHNNKARESNSDGFNVVGSHRIVLSENDCRWYERANNVHPDCIQGWSLRTGPVMTQIWLVNNNAEGVMQANLFGNIGGGSVDGLFAFGNRAWVTFSHTISCGGCANSVVKYNILASHPGVLFGIGKIKGFEGTGNVISDNPMVDGTKEPPPRIWWYGTIPLEVGSRFDTKPWRPGEAVSR